MSKKNDARRFVCLNVKCQAVHHYAPRTCSECGFGCVGEKPQPLNDRAFPVGKHVVAICPDAKPVGVIRGVVENLVSNSFGAKVLIKAKHDGKNYTCKLANVFWEAQGQ